MRPAWPIQTAEADFVPIGPLNTDGIIIANPLHDPTRSRYIQELIAQGHPILFVGSGEAGPTIVADNRGGILEAMGHLVEHGHKQVSFIAGTVEDMNGDLGERLRPINRRWNCTIWIKTLNSSFTAGMSMMAAMLPCVKF